MFKNLNTDEIVKKIKEKSKVKRRANMNQATSELLDRFETRYAQKEKLRKEHICGTCIFYNNFTNYCGNVSYSVFFKTPGCSSHTFCDA